ncbi:uncharacterized protein LOC109283767 [Alligator mississippiensis]|uniref:uncharacterized protein LOC109283767 n=1 Tax=Alligator mississippiensis TaxID=8496 RepID=UPI002877A813|nr:uncharacterized protein LOC109283767 [Alligator mississippiensis]
MTAPPVLPRSFLAETEALLAAQDPAVAPGQLRALEGAAKGLQVHVAVLGPCRAGTSSLVQALLGSPPRLHDPHAFFQPPPLTPVPPTPHVPPALPSAVLWDLPGLGPDEVPEAYVTQLLGLAPFACLVLVLPGPPGGNDVAMVRAVQARARALPCLVVRTGADLALHTAKRRGHTIARLLPQLRAQVSEPLARAGLKPLGIAAVSTLEPDRFDFAWLEDALVREVLQLPMLDPGDLLEELPAVRERTLRALTEVCAGGSLAEAPGLLRAALADASQLPVDVAVVGEPGSGHTSLIAALCGNAPGIHTLPGAPGLTLWDLSDAGTVDPSRYDLLLLTTSNVYREPFIRLARAAVAAGRALIMARTQVDVDLRDPTGSVGLREQLVQEGLAETRVFLLSSHEPQAFELGRLRQALAEEAAGLQRAALPVIIGRLVRRERRQVLAEAWRQALHVCLRPMEDAGHGLATALQASAATFGLDEASLTRMAMAAKLELRELQAQIRCPWAQMVQPSMVLEAMAPSPSLAARLWSYVPFWGSPSVPQPQVTLEAAYHLLSQAAVEMALDAERVLLRACTLG